MVYIASRNLKTFCTSNGYWVWHPRPSLPDHRPHTATHTTRDSNLGSGNHDMSRLSTPAYLNGAPIYGLADKPLRLLPTDIGWYSGPRTQNRHKTPQLFGHKNALTATKLASFLLAVGRQSAELVTCFQCCGQLLQ